MVFFFRAPGIPPFTLTGEEKLQYEGWSYFRVRRRIPPVRKATILREGAFPVDAD
jgi:hypothetical protein